MVNRSKNKGTAAETAVTRYARTYGFPHAQRRALAGSLDRGDIDLCPGVIVEVKAGAVAETASDHLIGLWLAETERERVNAGAAIALLVTKRKAVGHERAGQWACWYTLRTLVRIGWESDWDLRATSLYQAPLRMTVHDALTLLRAAGYGDELEVDA